MGVYFVVYISVCVVVYVSVLVCVCVCVRSAGTQFVVILVVSSQKVELAPKFSS